MGIEQEIEEYKKEGTWWYLNLATSEGEKDD